MVDILNVKRQRLSAVIADYCECESCHVVDRDLDRMQVGQPCQRCGIREGEGGYTYFHMGILSTIDLMQDLYHTPAKSGNTGLSVESHHLAVVVFFCTFVETLIENLIREIMDDKRLPVEIQEKLLWDNQNTGQRVEKLFPILAGEKWKTAVAAVSAKNKRPNFEETLKYCREVQQARNKFLHPPGNKWAISLGMAQKCLRQAPVLLELFVRLHNRYIAKPVKKMA